MKDAYACAVRLLARREHGAHELSQKLVQKGHGLADAADALKECQRLGLQNDARFTESICRTRIRQGYGPLRIQQELQSLRIDSELISEALNEEAGNWLLHAQSVVEKKYSNTVPLSYEELQKQKRFLQYRGFPMAVITQVFKKSG